MILRVLILLTAVLAALLLISDRISMPFPAAPLHTEDIFSFPSPRTISGNKILQSADRLFDGLIHGSETVELSRDGTLFMLDKYGTLFKSTDMSYLEKVTYIGPGRPLAFHLTKDEKGLIICDSKGLLHLDLESNKLDILANEVDGSPIHYANDLDISHDGTVYFSDSSIIPPALNAVGPRPWYDTFRSFMLTLFHGGRSGRLLSYNLSTGEIKQLTDKMWYANGVALAHDEGSFVLVVETCTMSVHKYWLKGPKRGTREVVMPNLPGFPDGISRSSDGKTYWLTICAADMPIARLIMPFKKIRLLVSWVPKRFLPPPKKVGLVMRITDQGEVVQVLMDPGGAKVSFVSAATESKNGSLLYLGNVVENYVSVVEI